MTRIKPNSYNYQNTGFTLLEILLVIIIMAIMAMAGITAYQRYATTVKIEQTAAQMRQLQQAATAYYTDNGCWPDTSTSLCPNVTPFVPGLCSNSSPPPFNTYLANQLSKNPWGNPYRCQPTGAKFQVMSGAIPNPGTDKNNNLLVSRVIALLPSGVPMSQTNNSPPLPNDPNQVVSEIVKPGPSIATRIIVKNIHVTGLLKNNGSFTTPDTFRCPQGWTPKAVALPFSFHLNTNNQNYPGWQCYAGNQTIGELIAGGNGLDTPFCTTTNGLSSCGFTLSFTSTINAATGLGVCEPDVHPPWVVDAGTANFTMITWCQAPPNFRPHF